MKTPLIFLLLASILASSFAAGEMRSSIHDLADGIVEWDAKDFSGFFFDLNKDIGAESLRLNISGGRVEAGEARYVSAEQDIPFEHKEWGSYRVLCFIGEKYFAGYSDNCKISPPWNSLSDGNFSRILADTTERRTLAANEALAMAEGYSISFSDAGNGVKVSLTKDGKLKNESTIQPPADYIYTAKIGDHNASIIAVHIKSNAKLTSNSYYTIDGIFQIAEDAIPVEVGSTYGSMRIKSIQGSELHLANENSLILSRNSDNEVLKGIRIKVTNSPVSPNRIYLYKPSSESGYDKIRGSVTDLNTSEFTWTPENFAGLYYDADENIGKEQITFRLSNVNPNRATLSDWEPRGITYATIGQAKSFEFKPWGKYCNMSFLGQSYFAGYIEGSGLEDGMLWQKSKEPNLLANTQLGKVLMDVGGPQVVKSGQSLKLKEGFEARLYVDDLCNKTILELYKNGNLTDRDYFEVPHTYVYSKDLGKTKSIVVLAMHVSSVNCDQDKSSQVDGIFQISDSIIPIEVNQQYGKMSIRNINPINYAIIMDNKDNAITLSKNKDIPLIGKIHIKTADPRIMDSESLLRYCIYSEES